MIILIYLCIDLKSFYASVECVERGYDPLDTNLVVADESRTDKTICLAVTPSLKAMGVSGRPRLFEAKQCLREVNSVRLRKAGRSEFSGSSCFAGELSKDSSLKADMIIAPPRMALYIQKSSFIYSIYLKYIAPEDIHVYSIDEVFMDITGYLSMYRCSARELAVKIIRDVLEQTGITATAGLGTNMFLAKIAMDIVAKKMPADRDGVRIAALNEMTFRKTLWNHTPLTDFWRFGAGTARRLEKLRIRNLGELARLSERNDDLLYREFGKNAELIIDHAWGFEPCTIAEIKAYRPENRSLSQGQVLPRPYSFENAGLIVKEMTDQLSLDLVRKGVVSDQLVLTLCYDHSFIPENYEGRLETDHYGKIVPVKAHGTTGTGGFTSSTRKLVSAAMRLYSEIADRRLLIRRIYIVAGHVTEADKIPEEPEMQYSFFDDADRIEKERENERFLDHREKNILTVLVSIKERYGKNAILKGMNFEEGGTAIERNCQVGGHRA